jgi:phage terminase Nu1 subunit (DNA packaging protein)
MKRSPPQIPGHRTEKEEADLFNTSVATLRRWRDKGYGPIPTRIGRHDLYSDAANERFLAERAKAAEAERNPRGRGRPRRAPASTELSI